MQRARASLVGGVKATTGAMAFRAGNQEPCRTMVQNTGGETVPPQLQGEMKATRVSPVTLPPGKWCWTLLRDTMFGILQNSNLFHLSSDAGLETVAVRDSACTININFALATRTTTNS